MKHLIATIVLSLLAMINSRADEGMWLPYSLDSRVIEQMKLRGLKLPFDQIYDNNKPSIKDAVVSLNFGNCTASFISNSGLLLTNHHCGYDAVAELSSLTNNYLRDGFSAPDLQSEIYCYGLTATILISAFDVTSQIPEETKELTNDQLNYALDSLSIEISKKMKIDDAYDCRIVSYFDNLLFMLLVEQTFHDVRLVAAPPSFVGKFGGDTDNWEWPRHTGDFCLFRVYASDNNLPHGYSPRNKPYTPRKYIEVNNKGIDNGDFAMVMGYPGQTLRYALSEDIIQNNEVVNPIIANVRSINQSVWKKAMDSSDELEVKYASKYSTSSNYWKNAIGQMRNLRNNNLIERRNIEDHQLIEKCLNSKDYKQNGETILALKNSIESINPTLKASTIYEEAILNTVDVVSILLPMMNYAYEMDGNSMSDDVKNIIKEKKAESTEFILSKFDFNTDLEVLISGLQYISQNMDKDFRPDFNRKMRQNLNKDMPSYVRKLYNTSLLTDKERMKKFVTLGSELEKQLYKDELVDFMLKIIYKYFSLIQTTGRLEAQMLPLRQTAMESRFALNDGPFYPDANSTLRISYGVVEDYQPADGITHRWFTTIKGILEKNESAASKPEYAIPNDFKSTLMAQVDRGKQIPVCFITNNDITGGNSGSPVLDSMGRLIGLAFDGNWEAMTSDYEFDKAQQRCINVDIRYILFILDHMGVGNRIRNEIKSN